MSNDLKIQIGGYVSQLDEDQVAIDAAEVAALLEPVRELPPPPTLVTPVRSRVTRHRNLRWAYGVAAAVVALLLVGGMAWLSSSDSNDVIDQSTTTLTTPIDGIGQWSLHNPTFNGEVFSYGRYPYLEDGAKALIDAASTPFGLFAVGYLGNPVWTSQDGIDWAPVETETIQYQEASFSYIGGSELGLVLISPRNGSWFSPDGESWTALPDTVLQGSQNDFSFITASERGFVVGANQLWFSPDGLNWTEVPTTEVPFADHFRVAASADGFYAAPVSRSTDTAIWRSSDGITWEPSLAGPLSINGLAASDLGVVAIGNDGTIWYSSNEDSWTSTPALVPPELGTGRPFWRVGASDDSFLVIGSGTEKPSVWLSDDGLTWTEVPEAAVTTQFRNGQGVLVRMEEAVAYKIVSFRDRFIAAGDVLTGGPLVWIYEPN